jgi:hypothetical protein
MATLNFIMPRDLKEGFCDREEKQHKNRHSWIPTGQSRAIYGDRIAIECVCKHCNTREWAETSRPEFQMLQNYWKELR